jgi:pyruvate dehydrogenase E1 component alpha subunit
MARGETMGARPIGYQVEVEAVEPVQLDPEQWLHMYEQMGKIRAFEEMANELYLTAKMPGLTHLYIGEEGVAVGVCEALRRDDYITSTHRGHGHCVAKGATLDRMFAELLGKAAGYCGGKGGSMHIADQDTGNLGANAIVGGSAGIATGAGLSIKMRKSDQVAVCFFGDGALGQGLIYESMNMAQLWKLPVLYVCENNQYNEYTHNSEAAAGNLAARGEAFGVHTVEVDGQDVRAVYTAVTELVARARRGEGPAFLVCHTYRFHGHHVGDIDRAYYRTKDEEAWWKGERDPLKVLGDWLVDAHGIAPDILTGIEAAVRAEVDTAVTFALNAPFPELSEVDTHVYA